MSNIFRPIMPRFIVKRMDSSKARRQLAEWEKRGQPVPPPHIVKQNAITEYQQRYNCSTLVETGTFMGDMVEAQKQRFKKIVSIELSVELFNRACKKFRKDPHVTLVQGDSGKVLPKICRELSAPALFWLDGHYSGGETAKGDKECPIFEELDAILSDTPQSHVLLIDDARLFVGAGDYPSIEKLTEYVRSKNPNYQVEVKHDIIRYVIG